MKKIVKKAVSAILTAVMLLNVLPLSASAHMTNEVYSTAYAASSNASYSYKSDEVGKVKMKRKFATATTINLSWEKADNSRWYNIYLYNKKTKKYELYYKTPYTFVKFDKLKKNTTYNFKIAAVGYNCQGRLTGAIRVKTLSSNSQLLPKPTGIKVTPSTTSVKLSWEPVKGAVSYRVYKYSSIDSYLGFEYVNEYVEVKATKNTSAEITGLVKNNSYQFKIVAVDKNGNEGKRTGHIKTKTLEKLVYNGPTSKTPKEIDRKYCKFGMKKETVLKNSGVANVKLIENFSGEIEYSGDCMLGDREARAVFRFNSKGELYSYSVYATCLYQIYQYELVPEFKRNYPNYTEPLRAYNDDEPQLLYKAYITSTESISLGYDILSVGISYTYEDDEYEDPADLSWLFED